MMGKWRRHIQVRMTKMALLVGAVAGWLFVPGAIPQAWCAVSDALTVTITPKDTFPPAAITDLSATPGGIGQMLLQWTAPDSNNNLFPAKSPASSYIVRVATFSVVSMGSTTTWWNNAQDVAGEPSPSTPGVSDSLLLNSLTTDVTYYAAIISLDSVGNISLIDVKAGIPGQQAAAYVPGTSAPSTPSNFNGVAQSTSSIQWTWNSVINASFYMLHAFPSGALIAQTTNTFYTEGNLTPNAAISRTISAGNGFGISSPSSALTVYTLAGVPNNVALSTVGFSSLNVTWLANGNPNGTQYRVERSLDGNNFNPVQLTTSLTFADSGLTPVTTYYYRVQALNGDGFFSGPSPVVSTVTLAQIDFIGPVPPGGLRGSLDSTGQAFTLIWDTVIANQDGSVCTDLVGYNVYRRTTPTGVAVKLTPVPLPVAAFADNVAGLTYYYAVTAVDTSNNESPQSLLADSSPDENVIYIGADGQSSLVMPGSVNSLLQAVNNPYGVSLSVNMNENTVPSGSNIVRHIRLSLIRTDTNTDLNELAFSSPQSVVSIAYGAALSGSSAHSSGVTAQAATPDQLSMYWHNGVTWVKVGGTLDLVSQTIKTKSSFLGDYQLRVSQKASSLTLNQGNVYPRLFTPNDDGLNDRVYFIFENPNNASIEGEILDLSGRHIANLASSGGTGIGTTLFWNGKDDSGSTVPSGAYMYKIRGEGKTFTGTVAVAR